MHPTQLLPPVGVASNRPIDDLPEVDDGRKQVRPRTTCPDCGRRVQLVGDRLAVHLRHPSVPSETCDASNLLQVPTGADAVTVAVTLRAAAAYLDRHGWRQGAYYDATGRGFTPGADMVGAIGIVCYGGPVDAPAQHFDAPGWVEFEAAVAFLDGCLADRYEADVYTFNDAPGRTFAEVRDGLQVAALQWDNRHTTPVCCEHLMAEQACSPAVFPPDGQGSWTVARVFRCTVCRRLAMRQIGDCRSELRAADRAKAHRCDTTAGGGA